MFKFPGQLIEGKQLSVDAGVSPVISGISSMEACTSFGPTEIPTVQTIG